VARQLSGILDDLQRTVALELRTKVSHSNDGEKNTPNDTMRRHGSTVTIKGGEVAPSVNSLGPRKYTDHAINHHSQASKKVALCICTLSASQKKVALCICTLSASQKNGGILRLHFKCK